MGGDLVFCTSNRGKYEEAQSFLGARGFSVRWERRALVEPQASTLESVVLAKLGQVTTPPGGFSLVEDSGLFIASLGGFPGVYSAYVLKTLGLKGVLRAVRGQERSASFVAVFGLKGPGGVRLCRGEVRGGIALTPRGKGGFGFDPIFIPVGGSDTFAQMDHERKSRLSHRARALRGLVRELNATARRARAPGKGGPALQEESGKGFNRAEGSILAEATVAHAAHAPHAAGAARAAGGGRARLRRDDVVDAQDHDGSLGG